MRTDRPEVANEVALREASAQQGGDREVLQRRQERLPGEHPSSVIRAQDRANAPEQSERGFIEDEPSDDAAGDADWRPLTDLEHADQVAKVRDLLQKAVAEGLDTESRYVRDPDKETWARERRIGHDAIIADVYKSASDVPCERRAILAGGLPGAGKTTVLEQYAGVDRSQYLTINPDAVKEELAKRGMIPEVPGLSPMEASELVHEESSHTAKQLALRAMQEGKNVIWDITMASRESTEKRITDLRSFGYSHVEAIFVDIPPEVSIRRVDARHRQDHDSYRAGQGLGGRYIAPEVVNAQTDEEWGSRNRQTFEEVKPALDAWVRYDNSVDGRAPVLAESKRREEDKI
jgi:predicted kinase